MKAMLLLLLAVLVPLMALAVPIITVADRGADTEGCPPAGYRGCSSGTFEVPVDGEYYLDVWTYCRLSSCNNCNTCAVIYPLEDPTAVQYCSLGCYGNPCGRTCPVRLRAGVKYVLQVCLENCMTGTQPCGGDCRGYACVRTADVDSPCWLSQPQPY